MKDDINDLRQELEQDTTQYSPSVMHHKAVQALASENSDALYDLDPEQISYFSYLRAVNEKLPLPATMKFINSLMSLSRSSDRKGRIEYAQALINRPVMYPYQVPASIPLTGSEDSRGGLLSRLLKRKNGGNNDVQ
ncbi:MAG: hypothetical protein PHW56_11335 [Methanosarcinaceae archaeon]|nr:hypothetical protein [Methanosarcinaceae archaeon]